MFISTYIYIYLISTYYNVLINKNKSFNKMYKKCTVD